MTAGAPHPTRLGARLLGVAACLPLLWAGPAAAQSAGQARDPGKALERVEKELKAGARREAELARTAERLAAELGSLRARLVRHAREVRETEGQLIDLEEKLRALAEREQAQTERLERDRERIGQLLAALAHLARTPPEALLARPGAPLETYRAARLLGTTVPELRAQAERLRAELDELGRLRADIARRRDRLEALQADLARQGAEMQALIAQREALQDKTEAEKAQVARRVAALSSEAKDLRVLLDRIEAERRRAAERVEAERRRAEEAARREAEEAMRQAEAKPPAPEGQVAALVRPPALPEREGRTPLPVMGTVRTRYGELDRFGNTSRGLTIATRPGATVVTPFDGSVMFAGPFRGYGLILIVEHANGYHSLLAGLGRIDTRVGQQVLAGEPVGMMSSPGDGEPSLYFELRRNGQPINPQHGIAEPDGKGQG